MIDTLLLDVDGVLQFPRPRFVADIERDYRWAAGFLAFQRELLRDPAEARSLVGDGDLMSVVERLLPRHVSGLSAREFLDRWLAENIEVNQDLLDLLPAVEVAQIYLATNQEALRGRRVKQLYAGRPGVTGVLISHELGHRKPHRTFFDAVLARVARRPQECLFVDDKPAYVAGAADVGITGLLYRDNARFVAALKSYGLLGPGHA
ncbi:haloacid dehalogenase [Paractinoplanes deccanensis]|uniref:Haloacid dehalogenase n=1 Tax=Paractinoplanes deccanensis TaxID=113561 RepID=A0ABQ3Y9J8_9ACTN|nr:HAD-IA family hydrolase [Actinoplanes deccanensis]GID76682.1 haloacid dehalogenase [Actinoplanes deccanensis]